MAEVPGRNATRPRDIPLRGWKMIFLRAWRKVNEDHVGLIAAGVAFYGLLAMFPAITALMAISGLIFDPETFTGELETVTAFMPQNVAEIVLGQAIEVAGSQEGGLGLAAVFGIAVALYSASKGVASLIEGMNVAYNEPETRGFIKLTLTKLGLTFILLVGLIAGLGAALILPGILSIVSLGPLTEMIIGMSRWAILLAMTIGGILVLYRTAPDRESARWIWLWPGAVLACVAWISASYGFSVYVENFGSYNESFGTLAGVIVLLMWLWISSYVLLFGAEINAEAEAQVRPDTTTGPGMPLGMRGAVKANELAGGTQPKTRDA
ncbi:YihY/virulence factor BrkB family protein [Marinovum sp.]|uniref:YihY/virulence factor BrkB family protein n=1 Tax=Marinovum sp. TaxID=2024839 RepID=UPI003A8D6E75